MDEIIFLVDEDPEGGYAARALGHSIFTQGDSLETLRENVLDATRCHFEGASEVPRIVRLHLEAA